MLCLWQLRAVCFYFEFEVLPDFSVNSTKSSQLLKIAFSKMAYFSRVHYLVFHLDYIEYIVEKYLAFLVILEFFF